MPKTVRCVSTSRNGQGATDVQEVGGVITTDITAGRLYHVRWPGTRRPSYHHIAVGLGHDAQDSEYRGWIDWIQAQEELVGVADLNLFAP